MTVGKLVPLVAGLCVGLAVDVFVRVGLLRVSCAAARGQPVRLGEIVGGADRFLPLVGALLLRQLIVVVGLVCLVLPGILFQLGLSLTEFFVVDRGMSPVQALSASWEATVGKKGRMFLYLLAAGPLLVVGYLAAGIGAVVAASVVSVGLAVIYLASPVRKPSRAT